MLNMLWVKKCILSRLQQLASVLGVNEFARIENQLGIHSPFDGFHDSQFAVGRKFFHVFELFRANTVFAGKTAADAVCIGVDLLMKFFNIFIPFFVAHIHLAKDDVQIAVANMSVDFNLEGIIFTDSNADTPRFS